MSNRARTFVVYLVAIAAAAGADELCLRYGWARHRIAFMLTFILVAFLGRRLLGVKNPPPPYSDTPPMTR